jgi:hypothetical protein
MGRVKCWRVWMALCVAVDNYCSLYYGRDRQPRRLARMGHHYLHDETKIFIAAWSLGGVPGRVNAGYGPRIRIDEPIWLSKGCVGIVLQWITTSSQTRE